MKKSLAFIYGIIAYLVFFLTFLYTAGFISNLGVPKTIDSGENSTELSAWLLNALLLSIFALQHSIMARPAFKEWWTKIIPASIERSTYVLFSSLALILLCWKWQSMTGIIWEVQNDTLFSFMYFLHFLGWLIVLMSTFMINHFELFGLKQVYNNLKNIPPSEPAFTTRFLYSIVRHPIMLGFIIAIWATPVMSVGHLFFALLSTAYIYIAVKFFEERDLRKAIGEQYVRYQEEVPMLFPVGGKKTKSTVKSHMQ